MMAHIAPNAIPVPFALVAPFALRLMNTTITKDTKPSASISSVVQSSVHLCALCDSVCVLCVPLQPPLPRPFVFAQITS
jgi:hypothetical protein